MPDTIVRLFEKELSHFPQEKMSIHTDNAGRGACKYR